jgi:hypothetical protein
MKPKLLSTALALVLLSASPELIYLAGRASADDVIRDADGKIVGRVEQTATGTVVRDENGKIVYRDGAATSTVVLDENGKIIRRELPSQTPAPSASPR